jgi:hypothetical protein
MPRTEVREIFERIDARPAPEFVEALLAELRTEYLFTAADDFDTFLARVDDDPAAIELDDDARERRGRDRPWSTLSRGRRVAMVAAVAAVVIGAGLVVRTVNDGRVELIEPADRRVVNPTTARPVLPALPEGLKGLPPVGASPSSPASGELIAELPIPIWVYEDGRVISARWIDHSHWTGFLEQRLTSEGVDLVRAEINANRPFEVCRAGVGWYGYEDGWCVGEHPGRPLDAHPRLAELPNGARSWLPTTAWADPEPKPYVPPGYVIMVDALAERGVPPVDTSAMLDSLPSEAAELLDASIPCTVTLAASIAACFEVSNQEARWILTQLGIPALHVNNRGEDGGTPMGPFGNYLFTFMPKLPHGPVRCCGG